MVYSNIRPPPLEQESQQGVGAGDSQKESETA